MKHQQAQSMYYLLSICVAFRLVVVVIKQSSKQIHFEYTLVSGQGDFYVDHVYEFNDRHWILPAAVTHNFTLKSFDKKPIIIANACLLLAQPR